MSRFTVIDGGVADDGRKSFDADLELRVRMESLPYLYAHYTPEILCSHFSNALRSLAERFSRFDETTLDKLPDLRESVDRLHKLLDRFDALGTEGE